MIIGEPLEAQSNDGGSIVVQRNGVIVIRVNDFDHVELFYGQLWYESGGDRPGYVAQAFTEDHTVSWQLPEGCFGTWSEETPSQLVDRISQEHSINSATQFRIICALERSRIKYECELLSEEFELWFTGTH